MPSDKKITLKQRILLLLADLIGAPVIRALGMLCRYEIVGLENLLDAERAGKGAIIALWHGRMLLPVYHLRNRKISALISLHNDGEMIARIVQKLGYITRRGSPKEGGMEGFKQLLHDLKNGMTVAIMPDGPTGPRYSVRDGVIHLARLSGAPIIPVSHSSNPRWVAHSWDRFNVMKPFSKGLVVVGNPFTIPRALTGEKEIEQARVLIRQALISVEVSADREMGQKVEESVV